MRKVNFLSYCISELKFIQSSSLDFRGTQMCIVQKKHLYQKSMRLSSSSKYALELLSEDKRYHGIFFIDGLTYENVKQGNNFKKMSIITNKYGNVRFSQKLSEKEAMKDISSTAKKIVFQIFLAFLLIGIPLLVYLCYFITLIF